MVEDEPEMARLVAEHASDAGLLVDCVASAAAAEAALAGRRYALVLLDRLLPDGDGLALVPRLRRAHPCLAVIVLSGLSDVRDRVAGLEAGADDYLVKPFRWDELLARIRATLHRSLGGALPIACGNLHFDPASGEVTTENRALVLRRRELALFKALIRRAGRVVPRDALMAEVYGRHDIQSNTLDAHISRLRTRLAACGAQVSIQPVRGIGYKLEEKRV